MTKEQKAQLKAIGLNAINTARLAANLALLLLIVAWLIDQFFHMKVTFVPQLDVMKVAAAAFVVWAVKGG